MCCCCCPSAISALFCLWVQSGCNKGAVAGALTFFPPEPALYEFERRDLSGQLLQSDEEAPLENDDEKETTAAVNNDSNESVGEIINSPERSGPLETPTTHGQTKEKIKSPFEQLADQAVERRKRSKLRVARDARDQQAGVTFKLLLDPRLQVPSHDDNSIHAMKIPSAAGVMIAAVLYSVPPSRRSEHTRILVYSHGNATDVGAMFPLQVVLSYGLGCDVLVYDYSGYGESGGVPEEASTYRDIDAVYDYICQTVVNGQTKKIILYGQSVGSGPCCYLANRLAKDSAKHAKDSDTPTTARLGGMILHSPFTSGMRVLTPSRALACLDIYPNIDRIKTIQCPCMIIHGNLDQEVDVSHGQELHAAVPDEWKREPWWVPDRGHNDITDGPGKWTEYVRRLKLFLQSLESL